MGKMKSFILFIVFCWVCSINARELTSAQRTFQNSIMSFLKEEGFSPSIDKDNSLTFKKEGELYWIDIDDNSPFYVEFHRSGLQCTDANMTAVVLACNKANKKTKCTKSIANEKSVSIVIEMYCHSSEEFKYIFYKSMKELDNAHKATKDYYNEYETEESSPFTVSKIEVANTDKDNNILTDFGLTIFDYKTRYMTPRMSVNVNKPGTYDLYVKFITPTGLSTSSTSPSGYSYKDSVKMETGTHTYKLSGWGNNTPGHWKKGDYRFEIYYDGKLVEKKDFAIL